MIFRIDFVLPPYEILGFGVVIQYIRRLKLSNLSGAR